MAFFLSAFFRFFFSFSKFSLTKKVKKAQSLRKKFEDFLPASMTSKMTASKIYLFIFNIEYVVETLAVRNSESRHYASVVRGHRQGHLEQDLKVRSVQ